MVVVVGRRKHLVAFRGHDAQHHRRCRHYGSSGLLEFSSAAIDQTRGQRRAVNPPATVFRQAWGPPTDVLSRSNMPCGCSTIPTEWDDPKKRNPALSQWRRGNRAELQASKMSSCHLWLW